MTMLRRNTVHLRTARRLCALAAPLALILFLRTLPEASAGEAPARRHERPDVILISLDTTRADHLSLYGYPLPTSPHLARLARTAVVFENAKTVIPLTGPSHASVFTSLFPHQHGTFRNGIPLKPAFHTMAEILREHGYDTAAFISGWTLREKIAGLDQGFRVYDQRMTHRYKLLNRERLAEEVTDEALAFIASRKPDRPLFLFVHYFDAHDPYRRHPGTWDDLQRQNEALPAPVSERVLSYDNELAYVDGQLGRLLDGLRSSGMLDEAILIVFGDHGESLGEHGYWGHGRNVHEPNLHVPLLLHAPRLLPRARRVRDPVCTLDVLPTLLSMLGLEAKEREGLEGMDLFAHLVDGSPLPNRRVYFETFKGTLRRLTRILAGDVPKYALYLGYYEDNLKYILEPKSSSMQVYDLARDPRETEDLVAGSPPALPMSQLLTWVRSTQFSEPLQVNLSEEDIEQLRSLGYVE